MRSCLNSSMTMWIVKWTFDILVKIPFVPRIMRRTYTEKAFISTHISKSYDELFKNNWKYMYDCKDLHSPAMPWALGSKTWCCVGSSVSHNNHLQFASYLIYLFLITISNNKIGNKNALMTILQYWTGNKIDWFLGGQIEKLLNKKIL